MKKSNNYSKFVATAATATLVATAVVPAASAQEMKFTDVGDRYADAVNYLVENNITQGLTETKFGTQSNIKRVDVAVLIAKATLTEDEITNAPASTFGDVPARATKYVSALKAKGIINGKTATSFGSDLSITRGEAAIMLSKAYEIEGDTANVKFGDVGTRYKDAVAALVDNKITTGKTDSSFGTALSITRGELAIFLHRLETLDATPAPEPEYKVDSVEAISGTQVQVKFTEAVNPATLFENGKMGVLKEGVLTMSPVGGETTPVSVTGGNLTEDGKTLTLTTSAVAKGQYALVIDTLKTNEGKEIEKFSKIVTIAADKTAPKVLSSEKVNASQYAVKFSEPISDLGTISYKNEDGETIDELDNSFEAGDTEVLFTLPGTVQAGKSVKVQIVAAKDMSDNLISPNPTSLTFTKGQPDGTAPEVKTVNQTGAKQFTLTFTEELVKAPTVSVGGYAIPADKVEKNKENALQYVVTTTKNLEDAKVVKVENFSDLSGEAGTVYNKVVTFKLDTVAPKVTSAKVVADTDNLKKYVEFTFDKDVVLKTPTVSAEGTFKKDFITSDADFSTDAIAYKNNDNKKVVRVALTDLLSGNDVENAAYDLTYTLSGVESETGTPLEDKTGELKFTREADGTAENENIVEVKTVKQDTDNNSKVVVTFDQAVDGASAVNLANYTIDGVAIKDITLNPVNGTTQTATLNLVAGSNTFNGVRDIAIKNIKAKGSTKTMAAYNKTVDLKENVAPVVTKADLTDTKKITLTFSEAVNGGNGLDFEVLSGGETIADPTVTVNAAVTNGSKTATISLSKALTSEQLTKGITLKPVKTLDIKDINGNNLSIPANITVAQ